MGTLQRRLTIGVGALFLGAALLFSLNQPGGPISETTGVVQTSGFLPGDVSPTTQIVTVRLAEGSTVQAEVPRSVLIVPGQTARLRVYRRTITGTQTYEVIASEKK